MRCLPSVVAPILNDFACVRVIVNATVLRTIAFHSEWFGVEFTMIIEDLLNGHATVRRLRPTVVPLAVLELWGRRVPSPVRLRLEVSWAQVSDHAESSGHSYFDRRRPRPTAGQRAHRHDRAQREPDLLHDAETAERAKGSGRP